MTVLSLVLCLATVELWVRSYWRSDGLLRFQSDADTRKAFGTWSTVGELSLFVYHSDSSRLEGWNFHTRPSSSKQTMADFAKDFPRHQASSVVGFRFGFGFGRFNLRPGPAGPYS